MANRVWREVYPQVLGRSCQLSLNKYFDLMNRSIRKACKTENWIKVENWSEKSMVKTAVH